MPRKPVTRNTQSSGGKATKARQGIANRDADEEVRRQDRVIPIRPETNQIDRTQRKRKAS